MFIKPFMTDHWRLLTAFLLVLGVFCYWYFVGPHILMQREASSLFVWDWNFIADRLEMPQGWTGLVTAFVVQFFYHRFVGAMVMALLAVFTLWAVSRLLRFVSRSWWLYVFSLAPAVYVASLPMNPQGGTEEEMTYDYLLRQGKWSQMLDASRQREPQTLACQHAVSLALFQSGELGEQSLYFGVTTSGDPLSGRTAAFIMSDVYLHMGMIAMSQRAAFEAMESIEDFNKSGRALQRLAITSLVCEQPEIARKYLLLLSKTAFYSHWAKEYLPLTEHPQLLASHQAIDKMRRMLKASKDVFFY